MVRGDHVVQELCLVDPPEARIGSGVGAYEHLLDGRELREKLGHPRQRVEFPVLVVVAVGAKEHLGLDLPEAVDNAGRAKVGRTRSPHGAERGCRQHGDDRLGHVGHEPGDAISGLDSGMPQGGGHRRYLIPELVPADASGDAAFSLKDDRFVGTCTAQKVGGEVESRVGKEDRIEHVAAVDEHPLAPLCRDHLAEVPHRLPEILLVRHRPRV